jgi:hypothetical protein
MPGYEIDFAHLDDVPAKIKGKFGFLYTVVSKRPYQRRDGAASGVLILRTCCAECGQPFEQSAGLRCQNLLRRCVPHRAAQKPATAAAQAAYDAGVKRSHETQRANRAKRKAALVEPEYDPFA